MDRRGATAQILLAVHDGEAYLREQLDSILAQTDGNWRLTASDDGSKDGSAAILDEYAARFPDKIERHFPERRFGNARDHFFYLMERCDAELMLFCDQDDAWYPDKLARTRAAMLEAEARFGEQTPILVFSDQVPTDEKLRPLAPSLMRYQGQYFERFDYRAILMQNVVTGGAMAVNRALARLGGRGAGDGRVIMHDWWLAAVAARFGQIVYIDEPLGVYRQHGGNAVGAKDVNSLGYAADRIGKLRQVRESILRKKAQAAAFQERYRDGLNAGDAAFLEAFARSRSGPGFFFKYRGLIHGKQRLIGMFFLN